MQIAYSIVPDRFMDDRHGAIHEGLRRAGYRIVYGNGKPADERDVLVTWTRHRGFKENACEAFKKAGGRVIVCEEPHIKGIPQGLGERLYSVCLDDHQAGRWYQGGPERWESFGIELKPWNRTGERIVVREQRSIGSKKMASPPGWHTTVAGRLTELTRRSIVIRRHPKIDKAQLSFADWLKDCWALVTWSSSDGTMALLEGIPVFAMAPRFFTEDCGNRVLADIDNPKMPDRLPAFERLAWAQWTATEIRDGEPFRRLMEVT